MISARYAHTKTLLKSQKIMKFSSQETIDVVFEVLNTKSYDTKIYNV